MEEMVERSETHHDAKDGFRFTQPILRDAHGSPALNLDFIRDLFAQFRPVTVRRMFSGAGIYCDGVMFALVSRGTIYLKADARSSADFSREGGGPFSYTRGKKSGRPSEHALPYWRLPERLYDDPDELAVWAERALAIAQRAKLLPRRRSKQTSKRS
jgi:DNA transformation protein